MNWRFQTGVMGTIMDLILNRVNLKLQWKIIKIWVEFLCVTKKGDTWQSLKNYLHTYISSSTLRKVIVEIAEVVTIADKGCSKIRDEG